MWIRSSLIAAALLAGLIAVRANIGQNIGGGIGTTFDGGVGGGPPGGKIIPATNCGTGVLDFSTGCAPRLSGV